MEGMTIDFGNPRNVKFSDMIGEHTFIPLESSDSSLVGTIGQIEIFEDRIYLLDNEKTNAILVFSLQGKFLTKLEARGNGPGEFISPHAFKLSPKGYLYVLDRTINKLMTYRLADLSFIEEIKLPYPSPLSFAVMDTQDWFIYYYPIRERSDLGKKQIVIANKKGEVIHTLYEGQASGKILHGNPDNIYSYDNEFRIYPYFTNRIYRIQNDSVSPYYNLYWGKYKMPDESLFEKAKDSNTVMKEILMGDKDWIRLLYIYETKNALWVKYYIKRDFYLACWNKLTQETHNVKAERIIDDIGWGTPFPLPVGIYNQQLIGIIYPYDIVQEKVKEETLRGLLKHITEESNPIIVLYKPSKIIS